MPPPRSREATSLTKLADYLEAECQIFEPDFSWRYYEEAHDPTMPPVGFIETPKGSPTEQRNYDFLGSLTYYNLGLRVSNTNYLESILIAHDWRSLLSQQIMRSLRKDGFDGYFQGINLIEWSMQPFINQDKGATTVLKMLYQWNDKGENTGLAAGNMIL